MKELALLPKFALFLISHVLYRSLHSQLLYPRRIPLL